MSRSSYTTPLQHSLCSFRATIGSTSCAFVLAGCVTVTPPEPAATSFAPQLTCTETITNATTYTTIPETPTGAHAVVVPVNETTECKTNTSGESYPYTVFMLPEQGVGSVNAGAVIEGARVLPPIVTTRDSSLQIVRRFEKPDYQHRGKTLSVLFTPLSNEKYVVVEVDPSQIGGAYSLTTLEPSTEEDGTDLNIAHAKPYSYNGISFVRVFFSEPSTQ